MEKTEEDWFKEELVHEFIDIREIGKYYDKHCEFDPDKHPERRELYNMLQFAYLYLEDNKRYEEYKKTRRVVLKGLDNSVKDWKEYFETKFETAMKTMDDRLRAEFLAHGEFEIFWEKSPWVEGDISKLFDLIPYAKLDLETEKRFYDSLDSCCDYSYDNSQSGFDDFADFEEYSENRETRIKSMLDKAAKLKKQKEEFDALNPPNYLHLVDYVEKLNQLKIPKSVVKPVIKPSAKPIVKPVIKSLAKNIPKSGLKTISAAKKVNVKEKDKVKVKKNLKPKVKVSKASKVPVKSAKKVSTVATK